MCGRFASATPIGVLAETFAVSEVKTPDLGEKYNVAPTDDVYAVAESKDGTRKLGTFHWGLVPFWSKDRKGGAKMINARVESVAKKHRRTLERRRCLIPADGFYEWQDRGEKKKKQPFFIHMRDGSPMAFAGLWEVWHGADDENAEPLRSCTIITTDANQVVARTHDRMPVILPEDAWQPWLDVENRDIEKAQSLLRPVAPELLEVYPVSMDVNNVRNDGRHLIDPLEGHEPE